MSRSFLLLFAAVLVSSALGSATDRTALTGQNAAASHSSPSASAQSNKRTPPAVALVFGTGAGNQPFTGALGNDFQVLQPINVSVPEIP